MVLFCWCINCTRTHTLTPEGTLKQTQLTALKVAEYAN